jgi:hypothetical protein
MASQKGPKRRRLFLHNKTVDEVISCIPSSVHYEEMMEAKEKLVAGALLLVNPTKEPHITKSSASMTRAVHHQQSTRAPTSTRKTSSVCYRGGYVGTERGFNCGLILVNRLLSHMMMMGIVSRSEDVMTTMKEGPSTQPEAMELLYMIWKGRVQSYMAAG